MKERIATVSRKTAETDITLTVNLDGTGACTTRCPIGFFQHLLAAFCKHGLFDLSGSLAGDLEVDQHHLVEDTGLVLGIAFDQALADRAGIYRVGSSLFPMDETLARGAVDFGGRPYLVYEPDLRGPAFPSFQSDTVADFWQAFTTGAKCALHLDILRGRSDHHKLEALTKAAARALRDAVTLDARRGQAVPSTKGVI
jgi:imidazoleglycerol-phosphate dehydratase